MFLKILKLFKIQSKKCKMKSIFENTLFKSNFKLARIKTEIEI